MPNYVKYITPPRPDLTGSLFKGNVALNIKSTADGPTSTTGWYSGIIPETDKFVIYQVYNSNDPDIFTPQSDQEISQLVKMKGGSSSDYASVTSSLAWFCTQPTFIPTNFYYEDIVTNGLVLQADAGFVGSFPQTGSTLYDLSGKNNNGEYNTLSGDPTIIFQTDIGAESGSISFTPAANWINFGTSSSLVIATGSMNIWVKPSSFDQSGTQGLFVKRGAYNIFLNNSRLAIYDYNTSTLQTTSQTIDSSAWKYVTLVFDSTGRPSVFYVNGVEIPSTPSLNFGAFGSDYPLTLASSLTSGFDLFRGAVGMVSVYNRQLDASEITKNYNAQKARYGL